VASRLRGEVPPANRELRHLAGLLRLSAGHRRREEPAYPEEHSNCRALFPIQARALTALSAHYCLVFSTVVVCCVVVVCGVGEPSGFTEGTVCFVSVVVVRSEVECSGVELLDAGGGLVAAAGGTACWHPTITRVIAGAAKNNRNLKRSLVIVTSSFGLP